VLFEAAANAATRLNVLQTIGMNQGQAALGGWADVAVSLAAPDTLILRAEAFCLGGSVLRRRLRCQQLPL
jgi:hypothetical protein